MGVCSGFAGSARGAALAVVVGFLSMRICGCLEGIRSDTDLPLVLWVADGLEPLTLRNQPLPVAKSSSAASVQVPLHPCVCSSIAPQHDWAFRSSRI